jgi:hypothetical protein
MKIRLSLRGGHSAVISAEMWGTDAKPSTPDEAYSRVRTAIAQGTPLEGMSGSYIRIERESDLIMTEIIS